MRALSLTLRIAAPLIVLAGSLHVIFGLQTDIFLGARIPPDVLADPALDSQNRFYGAAFTAYGVLLFICAADLRKYGVVVRTLLWVLFSAGVARLVSIARYGSPPAPILALLVSELVLPPLLLLWLRRGLARAQP